MHLHACNVFIKGAKAKEEKERRGREREEEEKRGKAGFHMTEGILDEAGFEFVCEKADLLYFRKRK